METVCWLFAGMEINLNKCWREAAWLKLFFLFRRGSTSQQVNVSPYELYQNNRCIPPVSHLIYTLQSIGLEELLFPFAYFYFLCRLSPPLIEFISFYLRLRYIVAVSIEDNWLNEVKHCLFSLSEVSFFLILPSLAPSQTQLVCLIK